MAGLEAWWNTTHTYTNGSSILTAGAASLLYLGIMLAGGFAISLIQDLMWWWRQRRRA